MARVVRPLPSETVDIGTPSCNGVHPDDREGLRQVHANTIAGCGRRSISDRIPFGAAEWGRAAGSRHTGGSSMDAAGQAVLMRGASREDTARKRARAGPPSLERPPAIRPGGQAPADARELHDNLSQQLALLSIEIEQAAGESGRSRAALARSLRSLGARTAEISSEIHHMSHRLHSAKLEALGLAAAVRGHCREVVAQGVQVQFSEVGVRRRCRPTCNCACSASCRRA